MLCRRAAVCMRSPRGMRSVVSRLAEDVRHAETYPTVPGLALLRDFLPAESQNSVLAEVRRVAIAAEAGALRGQRPPVVSPAHNLSSREEFVRVVLQETTRSEERISCEHFGRYGDGHQLTYFRGALPSMNLGKRWFDRLESLPWVVQELREQRERGRQVRCPTKWRMTLNRYSPGETGSGLVRRAGFPWHRDLEANGAVTMILALGSPGRLQFGQAADLPDGLVPRELRQSLEPKVLATVSLQPGALLVISGAARWELLHRVLPLDSVDAPERFSLVFGCW